MFKTPRQFIATLFAFAVLLIAGSAQAQNCVTHYDCGPGPYQAVSTSETATQWTWHCYYNSVSWGNPGYWCSEQKPAYSQPAYYSQPYYQAYYQGYYQSYYQGYYQSYYQGYYQGYYQAYYQGYYQSYYQGYYQGYYQSYYQGYYQPAYYTQPAYYSQPYYEGAYYAQAAYAPTVSWTPTSVTVGEGDVMPTFGYNSSGATQGCRYEHITPTYNLDWDYNIGTQNVSWPSSTGLHYTNSWSSRVTCKSPAGSNSATFNTTVQKNNAAPVSVTGPTHVLQSSTLNLSVTMQNTGAKQWNNDTTPHELCVSTSTQSFWGAHCFPVATATNNGGSYLFNISLPTPSSMGDFPLTFAMCEEGLKDTGGAPYTNGTCSSGVQGYFFGTEAKPAGGPGICDDTSNCPVLPGTVRVKNPTLAVNPPSITFPADYAAGDPAITRALTIGNSGAGTVSAGSIGAYTSPFSGPTSFGSLAAGQTSLANIKFQSAATGTWNSSVDVKSGVQSKRVGLIGTAVDMLTVDTSALLLNFGDANSAVGSYRNITIKNNSSVNSSGAMNMTFGGADAANFACHTNCTPASIPPGGTKSIRLKFTPAFIAQGGTPINYTAQVTLSFPALSKSFIVSLVGRGVPVKIQYNEK